MSTSNKIRYENLGRRGRPTTKTICILQCDECQIEFRRKYTTLIKHQEDDTIPGNFCTKCFPSLSIQREKVRSGLQKMLKNDPDWSKRNSDSKKGKINLGDKNGMKRLDARNKVSKFRKEFFRNPSEREKVSKAVSKAWREGKYNDVAVGKCKWFQSIDTDGNEIKVQGTWELAYAKWLVKKGIQFRCHRGRISYIDDSGKERNYYPDFYLVDEDLYVDIKNRYHYTMQKRKFDILKEQRPDIKIKLLFKEELDEIGVFDDQDS